MAATYELDLDLKPGGILQRVHLNQYDKGQTITIHLYNDGQVYTPVGTVWVSGTKKDNTGFQYQCSKTGSDVVVTVSEQMTCFYGDTVVEVTDIKEGMKQGSANFILDVERAAIQDNIVISKTDLPAVQMVAENIGKTEAWKNQAAASAKAAKTSENNAKTSESNAAGSARAAASSQSAARTSETNAKTSESNAAGSARAAASSQSAAKTSENNAKASENNANTYAIRSQSYAVGGTGTRSGEDVDSSKYYFEQSRKSAGDSSLSAAGAAENERQAGRYADSASNSYTAAHQSQISAEGAASTASQSANAASASASSAKSSADSASGSALSASNSATAAKTSETNAGNSASAAAVSEKNAKAYADNASAVAGVSVATSGKAGLVKPDNVTTRVDADGTMHVNAGAVYLDKDDDGVFAVYA